MSVRVALAILLSLLAAWGAWYLVVEARDTPCTPDRTVGCGTFDEVLVALAFVFPLAVLLAALWLLVTLVAALHARR